MSRAKPQGPLTLAQRSEARRAEVYPALAARGPVDAAALDTYCKVWARWREAEEGIETAGQIVRGAGGRVVASPLVAIANATAREVRALEERLGLGEPPPVAPAPAPEAPNGDLLSRRDLAAKLGVHMISISKWEQQGLPIEVRGSRGRPSLYSLAKVLTWRSERDSRASQGPGNDLQAARAQRERWQAALAEQQHALREGELIRADEVARLWAAEAAAVRTIILASYTTHTDRVHRAGAIDGLRGTERALKELAHEVLRELANTDREPAPMAEVAS